MQQDDRGDATALAAKMAASCIGVRVGRLHRMVAQEFERRLRPLGLSLPQLEILSTLTLSAGPVKPAAVAALLAVDRSTMSRNLAILQERGLVHAAATSATGRSLAVAITAAGSAALAGADQAWMQSHAALVDRLGAATPGILDDWLAALTTH